VIFEKRQNSRGEKVTRDWGKKEGVVANHPEKREKRKGWGSKKGQWEIESERKKKKRRGRQPQRRGTPKALFGWVETKFGLKAHWSASQSHTRKK